MVYAAAGVDPGIGPPRVRLSSSRPPIRRLTLGAAAAGARASRTVAGDSYSRRHRSRSRCRRRNHWSGIGWIDRMLRWCDRLLGGFRRFMNGGSPGYATAGSRCHRQSFSPISAADRRLSGGGLVSARPRATGVVDPSLLDYTPATTTTTTAAGCSSGPRVDAAAGCRNCQCLIALQSPLTRLGTADRRRSNGDLTMGNGDSADASLGSSAYSFAAAGLQQLCEACRQRVRINVSGQHFEIRAGLLRRHPSTLLGNDARRRRFYDRRRDELFFDRHRPTFEAVFAYYMYGGRLRRPSHVPDDVFLAELEFYELEPCAIDDYRRSEGYTEEDCRLPTNRTLRRLWLLFEYPETSTAAYIIAVISVIVTLISIVLFCVETLPFFAMSHCGADDAPNFLDPFFVIETCCTIWFTVEVVVRFIASPSKVLFWRDFKNIIDLTAIVPYYVTFINVVSTMSCASAKSSASLAFLRVIRLVRVFKLTKHSIGLQVLILTVKASSEELGLFFVILLVCMLVYSSAIYYAEQDVIGSQIQSIPDAFWWAIITMTTVGYGDMVPKGYVGKLIGAACAITGVLTLAMPVPIITGHFNRFYSHKTGRAKHI